MLKINIVCVGNLKDKFFVEASEEYLKRLSRFCICKVKELKEYTYLNNIEQTKESEAVEILKNLKGFVFLLDVKGEQFTSENFALKIESLSQTNSEITFIIGGSYGVSEQVKQRANLIASVSKMTFPHRLFRVMLLEQIYRAFTILNNTGYHK